MLIASHEAIAVVTNSWRSKRHLCWRALLAFALGLRLVAPVYADVRVLVLAADYRDAPNRLLQLDNTLIDAHNIARAFQGLGFKDVQIVENPSADVWHQVVDAFAKRLNADDVAVLYYAGHAVQVSGNNYFLAADGTTLILSEDVLSSMMGRARGTVFLIDACRNNPFRGEAAESNLRVGPTNPIKVSTGPTTSSRRIETVSLTELSRATGGLSQMSNLRGRNAIVLFSTDPGNVALDGDPGRGSPFANAVVTELVKRQALDTAIRKITADVDDATGGKQAPWRQGDLSFPLFLAGQPRFPVP